MNNLQAILKEQGRSKAWLGRKMGVTSQSVANWCKASALDHWKLKAIAELLNVEPSQILKQ